MCLSVLCSVLGARIFTSNQKNKFLKTLLIMIIAILCYQGSINLFITLVTLLLLIEDKSKNNKKIFKEIFLAGIISIIICVFSALIIYINNSILGNQQNRLYLTNGNKLINWINRIIFLTKYVMKTNFQLWPKMFIPIIILITTILLCFTKNAIKNIIKYIFIILIAILACTLPTYCMELAFLEPRTSMSIGAIVGISIIYLATNIRKEKIFSKIVFIIGLILLIFNSINTIKIFYYHIKTNEFDKIMALQIKKEIEKYE